MKKARLLVELDLKPELSDAFVDMFRKEFLPRSRSEEGCEQYELWRNPDASNKMTIVEVWASKAHLDTHLAQDWFEIWGPKLEEMQASPLVVRMLSSIED